MVDTDLPSTLDGETAQLALASVDLKRGMGLFEKIDDMLRSMRPTPSKAEVLYASMMLSTNCIHGMRDDMSLPFAQRVASGVGDLMADFLAKLDSSDDDDDDGTDLLPGDEEDDGPPEFSDTLFTHLVEDDGATIMTMEEFRNAVEDGSLTNDDGYGHPCIKAEPDSYYEAPTMNLTPGEFSARKDDWAAATHVVWYSR